MNLDKALDYLVSLVARGVEYPEAEIATLIIYNVDAEELRNMYDNL